MLLLNPGLHGVYLLLGGPQTFVRDDLTVRVRIKETTWDSKPTEI